MQPALIQTAAASLQPTLNVTVSTGRLQQIGPEKTYDQLEMDLMNSEMWQRVKSVVDPILECDRQSWPLLLMESCGDDVDVFLQASSLLEASQRLGSFIERPLIDIHARRPETSEMMRQQLAC